MSRRMDYDEMAFEYASHRAAVPPVLDALVMDPGIHERSRVLEVGCGTGNYIIGMHDRTGATCWGLDPSEKMLSVLRNSSSAVHAVMGVGEEININHVGFDLVFSVDAIHHMTDRTRYFQAARRVLIHRGMICTVTDSEGIVRDRVPLSSYFPDTVDLELERYPGIRALREEMVDADLTVTFEKVIEWPYMLTDVAPYRDRAYSSLHLISDEALAEGVKRIEEDLRKGPIPCVARYFLLWGRR